MNNQLNKEITMTKTMNYKELCEKLNVTDAIIKDIIEDSKKYKGPVYESEKYNLDWISKEVEPGCESSIEELRAIWEDLRTWATYNDHRKYYELCNIAACIATCRLFK